MSFELVPRDLDALLVKVEGVEVAVRSDSPDETVRQRSTPGSALDHYFDEK